MTKRARATSQEFDMGAGFYVEREQQGSCTWWAAVQLDAPGGYIVNHRSARGLGYRRDAEAQIAAWKQQDEEAVRECQTCGDISGVCHHD